MAYRHGAWEVWSFCTHYMTNTIRMLSQICLTSYKRCVQAFNWAGFDDGTTFLGGLEVNRTTTTSDFATVAYRAQLLGFNAVRLPFRSAAHLL